MSQRIRNWGVGIISISFLLQFFFTLPSWVEGASDFPFVSIWGRIYFGSMVSYALAGLLFLSCVGLIFNRTRKISSFIFSLILIVLVLQDINRLQPWLYLHLIQLLIIVFADDKWLRKSWLLLFSGLYIWSGLNKFNLAFAWDVFPYFMKAFSLNEFFYLPLGQAGTSPLPSINYLAWLIPVLEVVLGLLLLSRKSSWGWFLAVLLHGISFYILGPFGLKWNEVVWIWNLELLSLAVLMAINSNGEQLSIKEVMQSRILRILLFPSFVLPLLWYAFPIPHNLSFHLYSGYNPQVNFYFPGLHPYFAGGKMADFTFYDEAADKSYFMIDYYGMEVRKTPVLTEPFVYRSIGEHYCECIDSSGDEAGIYIVEREKFTAKADTLYYPCSVMNP